MFYQSDVFPHLHSCHVGLRLHGTVSQLLVCFYCFFVSRRGYFLRQLNPFNPQVFIKIQYCLSIAITNRRAYLKVDRDNYICVKIMSFDVNFMFFSKPPASKSKKDIQREMRDVIRQITASVTFLPFLEKRCKCYSIFFRLRAVHCFVCENYGNF